MTERGLDDPRALPILTAEHASLNVARTLAYNEVFSRTGMFLTFLGASLVAIGLIGNASGFTATLALIASVILATDLFLGLATLRRVIDASREEMACLAAMNRIRHAYRELVPDVAPYFSTPFHDDPASVLSAYGSVDGRIDSDLFHGLATAPATIGVVVAVVAAGLAGTAVIGLTADATIALVAGILGFVVTFGLEFVFMRRSVIRGVGDRDVRFPAQD